MKSKTFEKSQTDQMGNKANGADLLRLLQHARKVADLFFQFSQPVATKERVVEEIINELYIHATIENQVYHSGHLAEERNRSIMDEADSQHHVVKFLLADLAGLTANDRHYDSKVTLLGELIRHHIQEEEKEIFAKMRDNKIDLRTLADPVAKRKTVLLKISVSKQKLLLAA